MRSPGKLQVVAIAIVIGMVIALARAAAAAQITEETFDSLAPGALPSTWVSTLTGNGEPRWEIVRDTTAPTQPNALKQSGKATYPLAFLPGVDLKEGFVEVKFKAISGKVDQAGGVIWRCKDANNYYIARANALENNLTIYRTIDGKRISFKNIDIPVASGAWHLLRVDFRGNRFSVSFNGKMVMEATDDTLSGAGKVGLWTKADSVTLFDNFRFGLN